MCPDDETTGTGAEYLPPGEQSKDLQTRDEPLRLPEVPSPPSGIIRSAFLTAVRYRSTAAAVAAYTKAVQQSTEAVEALAELDRAALEHERARRMLDDAETIHKRDAAKRRKKLLEAEQAMRNEEMNAAIADMQRERKVTHAKAQHQKWRGEDTGDVPSLLDADSLSEDEKEFYDELEAETAQKKYDLIAQAVIDGFLAGRSEEQLNPDEREYIVKIRRTAKDLIENRRPFD